MSDGDGESVGDVVGLGGGWKPEDPHDHELNLLLFRGSVADDRELDFGRGVFSCFEASAGSPDQNHTARFGDVHDRCLILGKKEPFHRHRIWLGALEELVDFVAKDEKAFGDGDAGGLDEAPLDGLDLGALFFDQPKADAFQTGVDAENFHRLNRLRSSVFGIWMVMGRPWGQR